MKVLLFCGYYLPGWKANGTTVSVSNIVEALGDDIEFMIITRDRDYDEASCYSGVYIGQWNQVGKAKVFYAPPSILSFRGILNIIRTCDCDVIYLNGFFSFRTTIIPLLLRLFRLYGGKPTIIAPRGELSNGALSNKFWRKRIYLSIIRRFGLYDGLVWQASSESERREINARLSYVRKDVRIAPDICCLERENDCITSIVSDAWGFNPFRIIFLSRVVPQKNLEYLLRVVSRVKSVVELRIYGPIEDEVYWLKCERIISEMPDNVKVSYCGEIAHSDVFGIFSHNHLFVLPTKGENFGHVIIESLSAGTPVLISDRTPWPADNNGAVTVLSLECPDVWVEAIENMANLPIDRYRSIRSSANIYVHENLDHKSIVKMNMLLFADVAH